MVIGKLKIENPFFLAPMAGVTDYAFRLICKEQGAGIVYSEFVSAHGIIRENSKTLNMIQFSEAERPIGIQIFGDEPEVMSKAAKEIVHRFDPDLIDINYGCPVPKITKKGAGSAALKDLCLMDEITAAVIETVKDRPVTVKMRAGWDKNSIVIPEAGVRLEALGVSAITLHPRTANQKYTGFADWSLIKELKNSVKIPVIGNGDIRSPNDATRMFEETGCDAIMIGRAALGNPWIFKQLNNDRDGIVSLPPSPNDLIEMCERHLQLLIEDKGEYIATNLIRKHFGWYIKGFPSAASIRKSLVSSSGIDEMREILFTMKS
ncbi:MAG: tRNA dihydrouridine synthase DusB [Candidatus Marinimicrobia bacterium]|nr:tRNA dihydrouridine synthase DusB [Candidatus Neomarinimicrobiota bacterium]